MPEVYISPTEKKSIPLLTKDIATRSTMEQWKTFYDVLPNPDPILNKAGIRIKTLREIKRETRVGAATSRRKAGFKKRKWEIQANEASENTLQFVKDSLANFNLIKSMSEFLDAFGFGYQVSEVVWKRYDKDYLPIKVQGKPQEWFKFSNDNYLLYCPSLNEVQEAGQYKFLLTQNEADYTNPYGIAAYSNCFWPVTFKRGGVKFWARFVEKFGMPHAVGKLPKSAEDKEKNELMQSLSYMIQNSCSVIPDDSSVELLTESGARSSSTEAYKEFNLYHNAEISVAILGHDGADSSTPGKLGNEEGAMNATEDLIDSDTEMVAETVNTLIRWILELNPHRASGDGIPTIHIYDEEQVDKTLAERDKDLVDTGVRFTKKYFERNHKLAEDEFEVVEPRTTKTELSAPKATIELAANNNTDSNTIDQMTNRANEEIAQDEMIDTIREMASKANSIEEFQEVLLSSYSQFNEKPNGDKINEALLASELSGRHDIMDETGLIDQ